MISDGDKWHYLAISNLSALLEGKLLNHHGDFYFLNCFNSYTTKNKLKEHEEICNNHDSCRVEIPKLVEKILKYNPGEKSLKAPFALYLDLKCLLKKQQSLQNNPEKSYTVKKAKHEPSGGVMFTTCSSDKTENKLDYYRGRDCIENLCKKLKEHEMKIITYEKKKMIQLTDEENRSYEEQEVCHICKKKLYANEHDENYKNTKKVKDHCHYAERFRRPAHSICNLRYKIPDNIPIIIHNASYDTHFTINQLPKEFKGGLDCIGENAEKYITFSVPTKKCNDGKIITKRLRFVDSFRLMPASLSEHVDNLSGIFNSIECKKCMERKKINAECKFCALKNRLIYRCRECKEEWERPIEGLINKSPSIYQFCNGDLNKLILLLRKGVYPYEDMNN